MKESRRKGGEKRSGWKRDAEYKRGRIGGARSTDTTEPRRRFAGEARDGKEEKGEEEGEEAELVVHVLCPILYGERTLSSARLCSRKNESSFLGARTVFSLSLPLLLGLYLSLSLSVIFPPFLSGAAAVSISLFAGIVIKEGLGKFLSPRALPLSPSLPPSNPSAVQNIGQMD